MSRSSLPVFRLIQAATTKSSNSSRFRPLHKYNLQITCHVKPNASENREGIRGVSTEKVDVCVAAFPRKGEANAAVSRVIAQALQSPKSNVEVIRGLKSRDKTLCIYDLHIDGEKEEEFLLKIHQKLTEAVVQK